MLNTLKLKAAQVESGMNVEEIASKIGLKPVTVYRKMSGKSEFTASEMIELKKILHIDFQSFCDIFFGSELTETQENRKQEET